MPLLFSPCRLQDEVKHLFEELCILKEKLGKTEEIMCKLLKRRSRLEDDIAVKEASIQIDSQFVMGLRMRMPMDPKIGPMFIVPHVAC